ncbi:single-stranded-DNA-specific exonuclease RecJ [Olsenella sp. Marseille-P4559]|uniref:single-stranded-DNA-specific exonuclease RecJ n=1 Tax=Olsenella sp. Marseille-P4559 TaxID=2364795 RepID=UPI001F5E57B0|nr:single-stranded-DNA-specific exonuclease RecJ [Olsenella sp. Marseille-P4559]
MPGLLDSRRWDVLDADPRAEASLADALGVSRLVARVLVARGITGVEEARAFLTPSLDRDWADPLLIPGMPEAADRVERAVRTGEGIAVFGDFDVDGMSSTCILALGLRKLGGHARAYIPHRFGEGYGLTRAALNRVLADGKPDLIVTVDNGIAAQHEVDWLLEQGVDVVVTDHHEPADLVPQGVPVTDPKLAADGPSRDLAGAGVSLKLLAVLGERLGKPNVWRSYTDVAALGTLSDMMQLSRENRALVADGVGRLRRTSRPGLVALAACAGQDISEATADSLPFSIIPRLNAAGRMGTTDIAIDLLMTNDPAQAPVLAGQLEDINRQRRDIESALTEEALAKVAATWRGGRVIVVDGEGWHEGVKGIVASRIVNRYHVPAILFTIQDGIARGSGRSVGSVDLFRAVEQCSDMLVRFGGHAGAVGVTCEASRLDEFRGRLEAVLDALPAEQFESRGEVAAVVRLSELTISSIASLETLQPFGQGNKRPLLAVRGVTMRNRSRVGADGAHLRFIATDGTSSVPAIMFRVPDCSHACATDSVVDLVFEAVDETWQGRTKPKLMVKDILYRDGEDEAPAGPGFVDGLFAREEGEKDAVAGPAALSAPGEPAVPAPEVLPQDYDALTNSLVRALIGEKALLPAQREALSRLANGRSTLCVMATGRGKSLVFHVHAARTALSRHRASIFVYPLRALVADQAHHLSDELAPLGVGVAVLTGETSVEERARVYAGLASGLVDIVLTTPEYLALHADDLARSGRVGFLVVDEAHHSSPSGSGSRDAYRDLPRVRALLGEPVVLAVTATASAEVARDICDLCGIAAQDAIVDPAVRDNLSLDDCRDLRDRDAALASIVAEGEKCIAYVNSRARSVTLARLLRHQVPELAPRVAFYNAGLPRADRMRVERAFRMGELSCIVSTSAFGEGVNIPDVRSVVLYDMPLGRVEFNQMSGRAGRDGGDARVHLLFGRRDLASTQRILSQVAPTRDELVALYCALRGVSRSAAQVGKASFSACDSQLAAMATVRGRPLSEATVTCGIQVFEELGLLSLVGFGDARLITMTESPARVNLEASARYLEGIRERQACGEFGEWVLSCTEEELLSAINRPIAPNFGVCVGE